MKQVIQRISFTLLMSAAIAPAALLAQSGKDKTKEDKDKSAEQIIITTKGDKNDKVIIEINGDKVTVNGKDVKDNEDVTVIRNRIKDVRAYGAGSKYSYNYNNADNFRSMVFDDNRAMLGVTTEKVDNGVEIQEITKGSAAEAMGLKKGDVITKIDDKKIESPDDLSAAVRKHKPGEKISVTYLRDKKEAKETAELTKWKGVTVFSGEPGSFQLDLNDLNTNLGRFTPNLNGLGQSWSWSGSGSPKLGMSVQDAEDGKGVKVINVDDEGNAAKSGIKEDDVITEIDGKAVNSADEVAKIVRDSREKVSINVKLTRGGKSESVELKIPRRLKTANL